MCSSMMLWLSTSLLEKEIFDKLETDLFGNVHFSIFAAVISIIVCVFVHVTHCTLEFRM